MQSPVSIPAITRRSVGYGGFLSVSTVGICMDSRTGLCNFVLKHDFTYMGV